MNKFYEPLQEVIDVLGTQAAVAEVCTEFSGKKITQAHVSQWLNRDQKIPPRFARPLEDATEKKGSVVPRERLCPDVFG